MKYLELEEEMIKLENKAIINSIYHILCLHDMLDNNNLGVIFKMLYIDKLECKYICENQFKHIRTLYNLRNKFVRYYLNYK